MGIQTPGLQKWGDLVKGIPQVTLAWGHYVFESHNPPSPHPTLIPSSLSYILITIWPPIYTSKGENLLIQKCKHLNQPIFQTLALEWMNELILWAGCVSPALGWESPYYPNLSTLQIVWNWARNLSPWMLVSVSLTFRIKFSNCIWSAWHQVVFNREYFLL